MALRTGPPGSAPPSHSRALAPNLNRRAETIKASVLSILKVTLDTHRLSSFSLTLMDPAQDTDWPKVATNDVQALLGAMDTLPDIDGILKDETHAVGEVEGSIELVLRSVRKPDYLRFVSFTDA